MRYLSILSAAAVLIGGLASTASATEINVAGCAGVHDVNAGPGGVSVGSIWVTPSDCLLLPR
jgi:hypothetical protein